MGDDGGRKGRVGCNWRGVLVSEDGAGALELFVRLKRSQRPAPQPPGTDGGKGIKGLTLRFLECPSLRY